MDYAKEAEELPSGEERYARLKRAVKESTAIVIKYDNKDGCLLLDIYTASLLVQVADALERNRAKFLTFDIALAIEFSLRAVS